MKDFFKKLTSLLICLTSIAFTACGGGNGGDDSESSHSVHVCQFTQKVVSEDYLAEDATCKKAASYYYTCECGEVGTTTFTDGSKLPHDLTAEVVDSKYLVKEATCTEEGEYYKSCVYCGQQSYTKTFKTHKSDDHHFTREVRAGKYIKTEATLETPAEYYKSCICGLAGTEETFFGDKLRVYTTEEKALRQPMSLTVTLYDLENSVYGITYNTAAEPLRPVIQVRLANSGAAWTEFSATVEKMSSYKKGDVQFEYYICKAEVDLEPNKTYEYRAYDKYVDTGTEIVTFETKDPKAESFTFVNVTDTQEGPQHFRNVLSRTASKADFYLHTGDICEAAKYEEEWTEMFHDSFDYVSKVPIMAIAGNHDTIWKGAPYSVYRHFHYNVPKQNEELGSYYSFIYGNVKFIMLNTNKFFPNGLETEQYDWLVNELKNNTCKWTIVAMHHVMYSSGVDGTLPDNMGSALNLRNQLQAVFAEYGVDIVIQGHDHRIVRTKPIDGKGNVHEENWITEDGIDYSVDPNGIIYVENGVSGVQAESHITYEEYNPDLFYYAEGSQIGGWAEFEVSEDRIIVTVKYSHTQVVLHRWGIKKTK